MALELVSASSIQATDGKTAQFTDQTGPGSASNPGGFGYGGNPSYASITGVRLLIGNYNAFTNIVTLNEGDSLVEYFEYVKSAGDPSVYDNKTVSSGDSFIPYTTGLTVLAGDQFITTGRYNPFISQTSWLPDAITTPLYLSATQLGFDSEIIPDTVIGIQYEVYGAQHSSGFTSTSGIGYLVTGTGTVSYSGNTYRPGEAFTATDASSIASVSGTFKVSEYEAGNYNSFITAFNVTGQIVTLQVSNILNPKPDSLVFDQQINNLYSKLDAMNRQAKTGLVSYDTVYSLLQYLVQKATDITNGIY